MAIHEINLNRLASFLGLTSTAYDANGVIVVERAGKLYSMPLSTLVAQVSPAGDWQDSVVDATRTAPPASPSAGDRHIIDGTPTGAWSAFGDGWIATYDGAAWSGVAPKEGMRAYVAAELADRRYVSGAWAPVAASGAAEPAFFVQPVVGGVVAGSGDTLADPAAEPPINVGYELLDGADVSQGENLRVLKFTGAGVGISVTGQTATISIAGAGATTAVGTIITDDGTWTATDAPDTITLTGANGIEVSQSGDTITIDGDHDHAAAYAPLSHTHALAALPALLGKATVVFAIPNAEKPLAAEVSEWVTVPAAEDWTLPAGLSGAIDSMSEAHPTATAACELQTKAAGTRLAGTPTDAGTIEVSTGSVAAAASGDFTGVTTLAAGTRFRLRWPTSQDATWAGPMVALTFTRAPAA